MASKRQAIMDAIKARFQAISIGGGYATNVGANATPWKLDEGDDNEYPFLSFKDPDETVTNLTTGGTGRGTDQYTLKVECMGGVEILTDASTPDQVATVARQILQDLVQAVGQDQTWGIPYAYSVLKATSVNLEMENKVIAWAFMEFQVIYQTGRWNYTA
jgi:hypothetical protein